MSNSKKIALKSSNGEVFEIEETVALQSKLITHMIEDGRADKVISLANITGEILTKVIEYCKKHVDGGGGSEEELKIWDAEFMKNIDQSKMIYVVLAAKFLDIESLLSLSCRTVGNIMVTKTIEENRKFLHLKNDFTPEEEAKIREENSWAFED